jgi:alkylation response protein AidB-like acyl-CoA dehydrogenase
MLKEDVLTANLSLFTEIMIMKNPSWMTEEHMMLRDTTRKFLEAELVPNLEEWGKAQQVDRQFWYKAGELGILGASISEEYGGFGGDLSFDAMVELEHAATGDAGWGWGVHNMASHYVEYCGTEEQKKKWLPGLISGELVGAIAMTEPGTGSDLQSVKTSADKDGDDYIINGSKIFITNGGSADLLILVAKTDKSAGGKGISLIIVDTRDLEGFSRGNPLHKIGQKAQDTCELFFQNVRVSQENLLGGVEGQGFIHLMKQLPWERLVIGIGALGASTLALDTTIEYVKDRKAFGKRIMDFQNTQFKLAECATKLDVMRNYVYEGIELCANGELDPVKASMIKLFTTDTQCEIIDECLQLHGGYGYMTEYTIGKLYADARVQRIYGGTNEIMKVLISRSLDQ